jgi:hypothetical protein
MRGESTAQSWSVRGVGDDETLTAMRSVVHTFPHRPQTKVLTS